MSGRVAVIGAGIAGATCAHSLRAAGAVDVTMFDMGRRGPGKCLENLELHNILCEMRGLAQSADLKLLSPFPQAF
jgi:2-polyprenyl-6-methoxyphenol hydroxylase-like FAD-dependent oxidoreductase